MHPEALKIEYPLSGVISNTAVCPSLTVIDVGEIVPLSPADAVIEYIGIGAGVESPSPPPHEIKIGKIITGKKFFIRLRLFIVKAIFKFRFYKL